MWQLYDVGIAYAPLDGNWARRPVLVLGSPTTRETSGDGVVFSGEFLPVIPGQAIMEWQDVPTKGFVLAPELDPIGFRCAGLSSSAVFNPRHRAILLPMDSTHFQGGYERCRKGRLSDDASSRFAKLSSHL